MIVGFMSGVVYEYTVYTVLLDINIMCYVSQLGLCVICIV